jgi:Mn2+/Fe2+ NRAMP family transporter
LIVKGTYDRIEKVFLFATSLYVAYIISGILVKPDWKEAMIYSVRPVLLLDPDYITLLIGMVGTSVAPWMQFYLQAAVVEKGISVKAYAESRIEVIVGCVVMSVIAFFIIVACAGAIGTVQPRDIRDPADAALGLKPFGPYAFLLFGAGLFNASIFAASILPLSTAYTVCEGLGFESGVNRRFSEAPVFYWLFTLLVVGGAGSVLIPHFPLVPMILGSQVINGILLPLILIFMIRLVNDRRIMKDHTNSRAYNIVAWASVVILIGLTFALVGITVREITR